MIDDDHLEDEQRTAKETLEGNVTLRAGAGTGKTTTLTARYVELLEHELENLHDHPDRLEVAAELPEHILTTTFTERAASDLQESVRAEVNAHLTAVDDETTFELWRAVADGLDDAYIHTLHGLCHRLLEEHAIGSRATPSVDPDRPLARFGMTYDDIDPGFDVLDEGDAETLARQSVAATLHDHQTDPAVRTLARRFDRHTLEDILYDILTHSPRSDTYQWLARIHDSDDETAYAEDAVAAFLDVNELGISIADIDAASDTIIAAAQTVAAKYDDTHDDLNGNLVRWVVDDIVDHVEANGLDGTRDPGDLSVFERRDVAIALVQSTMTGSGGVHDDKLPDDYPGDIDDSSPLFAAADALDTIMQYAAGHDWHTIPDTPFQAEQASFEYVQAFGDIIATAFDEYAAVKRDEGVVDYGDLVALTNHFLASLEPADRARIGFFPDSDDKPLNSYAMVDEFQDTNADQWAIINALTCQDPSEPTATNRFIVGDDKQSIYRFRGADVSIFEAAQTELDAANDHAGLNLDQPPLRTNFRTLPDPLTGINGLFEHIFVSDPLSNTDDDERWYETRGGTPAPFEAWSEPLAAARTNHADITPATEYIPVPVDTPLQESLLPDEHALSEAQTTEGAELEAAVVANRLAELLTDGTQVYEEIEDAHPEYEHWDDGRDGPVERPREVTPGDVAILLRSRSDLDAYERALRDASIPHTVIKGQGFFETPEIETLVNLLRVLVDPSDERALYALLRSPLFGCTDDALAQLALTIQDTDDATLWDALTNSDADEWTSIASDLRRFRGYAGQTDTASTVHSWADLLTQIFDETGYLAAVAADERGEKAVVNVERFRDRLRTASTDDQHSLAELLDDIERHIDSDAHDPEANVVSFADPDHDSPTGSVSLLTVHEAKGMEYPVVVVPGLARDFTKAGGAALGRQQVEFETVPLGTDGNRTPVFGQNGPKPTDPYTDIETVSRRLAKDQRQAEERAEEKRILYVACTRARDHLILTGQHTHTDDSDYPHGFTEPDPTDANTWQDWIQAILFDTHEPTDSDDEHAGAAHAITELINSGTYERTLEYSVDDDVTTGTFTVRQPPRHHAYDPNPEPPSLDLNAYEPPRDLNRDRVLSISPHECSKLAAGDGELVWHDDTTLVYEAPDYDNQEPTSSSSRSSVPGDIPANVFGTIVHRLCELRPTQDNVKDLVDQLLHTAHDDGDLTTQPKPQQRQTIADAAQERAARVDTALSEIIPDDAVQARYDEFQITIELDGIPALDVDTVAITGEIDHLIVTNDAYYIIDYKTDRPNGQNYEDFVDEQGRHHQPQVFAYAAALREADPSRSIHASLIFTEAAAKTYDWHNIQNPWTELTTLLA